MMEGKNKKIVILAAVIVPFLAGFLLSYYLWGFGKYKNLDHKRVLQETINYISIIENKNESLSTKLDTLETEVNSLKQREQQSPDQKTAAELAALNRKVAGLEQENLRLKTVITDIENFARENPAIKEKIDSLVAGAERRESPQEAAPQGAGQ